jgi:hypothetical protein
MREGTSCGSANAEEGPEVRGGRFFAAPVILQGLFSSGQRLELQGVIGLGRVLNLYPEKYFLRHSADFHRQKSSKMELNRNELLPFRERSDLP